MKISEISLKKTNDLGMVLFSKEEFKMVTGIDLDIRLEDDDDPTNKAIRFISYVGTKVAKIVSTYTFHDLYVKDDEIYYGIMKIEDEERIRLIKQAAIEQGSYMLSVGDTAMMSGISATGRKFSNRDKKKAEYSENAKDYLWRAGLLNGQL